MNASKPMEVQGVAGRDAAPDVLVDLMGQVAHDLNNQLATILGKSEIAMMVDDPARWKSAVEESHKAGQKARVLVADFQRLYGWLKESGATQAPLSDVIGLLRRVCERRLARSGVIFEPAHAPSRALGDPVHLFLLLWLVLLEALERGGNNISATWTLAGREGTPGGAWTLQLVHPGTHWDSATRALGPGVAASEGAPRRVRQTLSIAQHLGAEIRFEPESVLLSFRD